MKIKPVVEKLDDVPEDIRESYIKRDDGTYALEGYEDVTGLKRSLDRERDAARAAARQLSEFKEKFPDGDIEAFQKWKADAATEEEKRRIAAGEFDRVKEAMVAQHNAALAAANEKALQAESLLHEYVVASEAARACADPEIGASYDLLEPHIRKFVKPEMKDGKIVLNVLGEEGTPLVDANGKSYDVKQLLGWMRAQPRYQAAFAGRGHSGGGMPNGGQGGGGAGSGLKRGTMTPQQKAAFILENGQEAYFKLAM